MQVTLSPTTTLSAADRDEAEAALRQCVHCGMCNATCPTFQLTGDELEGPRGRIYLIKSALEGVPPAPTTLAHLDRCLTCRSCETTCPSQVPYARLAEIGRREIAGTLAQGGQGRSLRARAQRWALREGLTRPRLFGAALRLGQTVAPLLPASLRACIPLRRAAGSRPAVALPRRVILLEGCVQPALDPGINAAAARVLAALGIQCEIAPGAGCCGAVRTHLDDMQGGLQDMRRNVDAWTPLLDGGAEAIVSTASGCGLMLTEYGHQLREDAAYAAPAAHVATRVRDISELLLEHLNRLRPLLRTEAMHAVYHPPCTLQHGLKLRGAAEQLLTAAGVTLAPFADQHLCCGSAGTYSVLQPDPARRLRDDKLASLCASKPAQILTANIGCQTHLQAGTATPVRHWIQVLDERLRRD